jgi:hypothetical protein
MKNGNDPQQQIQINPQTAANYALQFLDGVAHTRAQREGLRHRGQHVAGHCHGRHPGPPVTLPAPPLPQPEMAQ